MKSSIQAPNTDPGVPCPEPPRRSPWSAKAKLLRLLWGVAEVVLWRTSPVSAWGLRRMLLRCFGARVGRGARVHPSVKVIIPWHIRLGDGVVVHERAILYALGEITVGQGSEIGPLAHICAGTHDFTSPSFTLLRQPIVIGSDCVVGVAAFIAPGVVLADRTILEPRCAIYSDTRAGGVYIGNPGRLSSSSAEAGPGEREGAGA